MARYIETAERLSLPVVALRGNVAFPGNTLNFELTDKESIAAIEEAVSGDSFVFLVKQTVEDGSSIKLGELHKIGTVSRVKQFVKNDGRSARVLAEGFSRATALSYHRKEGYVLSDILCRSASLPEPSPKIEGAKIAVLHSAEGIFRFLSQSGSEIVRSARQIDDLGLLCDLLSASILIKADDKQAVLECFDPFQRAELLITFLEEEAVILACEEQIRNEAQARIEKNQREYYLKEQLRAIEDELGEGDGEIYEYKKKILSSRLPKEVEEKLLKENERMAKTPYGSPEANVLRNYLDVCLELPFTKTTKDRLDIKQVKKILDEDHDGLEKVKERILEYLAVKELNPEMRHQILCLVGPPGVGKTSIASSIARAMNRKYARVSLGGVRDEADIRGHRKTYIGAMPGRIMTALTDVKVKNPLMLLDEIDKLCTDAHGDPASALLEVLDPEQNRVFRDHFVEMPFDLSDCFFLATANTLDTVPRPLIDRMEIIRLDIYTKSEKLAIAKNHLYPKQLKRHGLSKRMLKITDGAFLELITYYTHEAGVRNLERTVASLCRKAAKKFVEDGELKSLKITEAEIPEYLGKRKVFPETIDERDEIGVVNGLAYTELGGDLLKVECAVLDGTGKLELTGSLGDVMKESARAAVTYVRSIARDYGIPTDFYQKKDIHFHFPEGAVPKDGPSAGVTITTALVSALAGIPVKNDVAMTGEISLRGRVLPIGGLKEKTMAAYTAGVKTVLIPAENQRDLDDLDPTVKEHLRFILCESAEEVLKEALREIPERKATATQAELQKEERSAQKIPFPKTDSPNRSIRSGVEKRQPC